MLKIVPIQVECYAGFKANESPRSFTYDNKTLKITDIIDRWHGLEDAYFKVKAEDEDIYLLKYDKKIDKWYLEIDDPTLKPTVGEDKKKTIH